MKIRQKLSGKIRRTGREADLGQKEAKLEKTQAELEQVSEEQLSHMGGGKAVACPRATWRGSTLAIRQQRGREVRLTTERTRAGT